MALKFSVWLFAKSLLIMTPLEETAKQLRWLLGVKERHKHPELWELYLEERRLPFVLEKLLTKDSCGVDVGSHIGSFLSLLIKYAPSGHHIAFEPVIFKSKWLRRRFPNVQVFSCAISNENGQSIFEENIPHPGFSRLLRGKNELAQDSVVYEIETRRLDDVLPGDYRVDLIKLDIEGGELAALRGGKNVIEKWRPALIFECGSEYFLRSEQLSRRELYDLVTQELDYEIFCFAEFLSNKGALAFDEFLKCGLYPFRAFNFVALPRPA